MRKKFAADFETTTKPEDCRVWLWCICALADYKCIVGETIEEFFDAMAHIKNADFYFHNLKFDGQFLLSYALTSGRWKFSPKKEAGTFSTIISDAGQFYMIEFVTAVYAKSYTSIRIYDSLKKLPDTVRKIAIAFDLDVTKGDIDYNKDRPRGYKPDYIEIDYVKRDCIIVAKALNALFEKGLDGMTASRDALNNQIDRMGGKKAWRQVFPILTPEMDAEIRKSYRGGCVQVNPHIARMEVRNGFSFDVNSMYPWAMLQPMPYGVPLHFDGKYKPDDRYPLFIQHIRCEFAIKPGRVPSVQLKHNLLYSQNQYITESVEQTDLYLTSVDCKLFFEQYDVYNYKFIDGWKFKQIDGVFADYIRDWYKIKKASTGAMRVIAKLMLNSLYGKLATRMILKSKYPYLDKQGVVRYALLPEETRDPVYTAAASFITSYGRDKIIRAAQAFGGFAPDSHFAYMDTDSVHVFGLTEDECRKLIPVDNKELGFFKIEYAFKRAKYIRQKCYIEEQEFLPGSKDYDHYLTLHPEELEKIEMQGYVHDYIKKCAGMPDAVKDIVTYDEFDLGYKISGVKLQQRNVPGGCVLMPVPFELKAH